MRKPLWNLGLARTSSGLAATALLLSAVSALAQEPPLVYSQENAVRAFTRLPPSLISRNSPSFGNCQTRLCSPMGYATPGGPPRSITARITSLRLRSTGRVQSLNVQAPRQMTF